MMYLDMLMVMAALQYQEVSFIKPKNLYVLLSIRLVTIYLMCSSASKLNTSCMIVSKDSSACA